MTYKLERTITMATKYQARHSSGSQAASASRKKADAAKAELTAMLNSETAKSSSGTKLTAKSTASPAVRTARTSTSAKSSTSAASAVKTTRASAAKTSSAPIKTTQTRKASEKSAAPEALISSTQVMRSVSLDPIMSAKKTIEKANESKQAAAGSTAKASAVKPGVISVKTPAVLTPIKAETVKEAQESEKVSAEKAAETADMVNPAEKKSAEVTVEPLNEKSAEAAEAPVKNEPEKPAAKLQRPVLAYSDDEDIDISSGSDNFEDMDDIEDYEERPEKESKKRYKAYDDYEDDYVDDRKFTFGKLLRIIVSVLSVAGMIFFLVPLFKSYFTINSVMAEVYCLVIFILSTFKGVLTKHGKRLGMTIVWHVLAVIMLLSTCWFGFVSYQMYAVDYSKPAESTTVVVLGAKVYNNGVSVSLKNRLDTAYSYIATHPEASVVVTGGQGSDEPWSEASAAKAYLLDLGVDEDRILVEDRSTSTEENLEYTKQILSENNLGSNIILVTQSFHMFRASSMAKDLGYTVYCQSCETNNWLFPTYYARELLAITKYYLGKLF